MNKKETLADAAHRRTIETYNAVIEAEMLFQQTGKVKNHG
jgi:hypothetical protein